MGGFPRFGPPRMGLVIGSGDGRLEGPTIRRGKSEQVVETPWELVRAVEGVWGPLTIDLACTRANAKAPLGLYHDEGVDALAVPWAKYCMAAERPLAWLNHEWKNSTPWVAKCAGEMVKGARIVLLSRASVDSDWWVRWVAPFAVSYTLTPRPTFVGQKDCYPSPLAISLYGVEDRTPGLAGRWNWVEGVFERRVGDV